MRRYRRAMPSPITRWGGGHTLELQGRGRTWVRDIPGPTPEAPVVLLLHGYTATADLNWVTSYSSLRSYYRVLAIDHRGHGRGIRSRRPFRLEDCADDAAAACAALGVDRVLACGYSMGGPVAMLHWRRHRQLVDGLVLCATARRFGPGGVPARVLTAGLVGASVAASPVLRSRMVRARLAAVFGRSAAAPWVVEQVAPHDHTTLVQAGAALSGFDASRWLGKIDVPTAVVVTTRDTVVAPERQRALAAAIPGARIEEATGGHAIVLDAPRAFVPVLVRALHAIETDARRRESRPTHG